MWRLIDRYLGRGAYRALRAWLAPERERVQDAYPALVVEALDTHARWLDAGCGHHLFEPRFADCEARALARARLVVGCDESVRSLTLHRSVTRLVGGELDHLPFADQSFDLVTLHWVVEHLPDPQPVFHEIRRVLAPDGLLILRTPNAASYYVRLVRVGFAVLPRAWIFRLIRYMQHRGPEDVFPTYYRANTRHALTALAWRVGLVPQRITLLADQPLFYCFAPIALLELLGTRIALNWLGWHDVCADTLLAVLRRPQAAPREVASAPGHCDDTRPVEPAIR